MGTGVTVGSIGSIGSGELQANKAKTKIKTRHWFLLVNRSLKDTRDIFGEVSSRLDVTSR